MMRVRPAEAADVPQMTALYNHYVEHTAFTFDVDPWTVERRALLAILEAESLRRAFAVITLPNEPSERLHRRFGYSRVGLLSEAGRKFGRFWDVSIWQRALGKG